MRKKRSADDDSFRESAELGSFWSGTITFGLVSIPVDLYPAHRTDQVPLRMLAPDGTPVARRYTCERDGRDVPDEHLVRGYEVEPGKHVVVTDDELKRFVDVDRLDPVRFDRPYLLAPGGRGTNKAYRLMASVMERTRRAGLATFVMGGKEHIVAILAEGGVLRAETLRFADEIRTPQQVGLPKKVDVDHRKVAAFAKAIAARAKPALAPSEMEDPRVVALKRLVATKGRRSRVASRQLVETRGEAVDLQDVLARSLKRGARSSRT